MVAQPQRKIDSCSSLCTKLRLLRNCKSSYNSDFFPLVLYCSGTVEVKDSVDGRKDPLKIKNDLDIDKIKRAAVTALSAAAVKAKYLADQEEDQIRLLTTALIEKQVIMARQLFENRIF